jgi:hypothetical protein
MRETTKLTLRMREAILRAIASMHELKADINAPHVMSSVITRDWEWLRRDDELMQWMFRSAGTHIVAAILKELGFDPLEEQPIARGQLEMFPEAEREVVQRINRGRLYIPSRKAFCCYDEASASDAELEEAARYLHRKARGVTAQGDAVMALLRLRRRLRRQRVPS